MTTHTPGKWMPVADCQFGTESTKIMCGSAIVAVCYGSNHANDARMIAATPDLLEALREICEWTERNTSPGHPIITVAKRAIAKATGEIT